MRLIDILNKIANGELKEGTKLKVRDNTYEFTKQYRTDIVDIVPDLVREDYEGERISIFEDFYLTSLLNDELELIEPEEPTDNTKIEELKQFDMDFGEIDFASHEEYARCSIQVLAREMIKQIDKLNEVIRKINKEE